MGGDVEPLEQFLVSENLVEKARVATNAGDVAGNPMPSDFARPTVDGDTPSRGVVAGAGDGSCAGGAAVGRGAPPTRSWGSMRLYKVLGRRA